MAKPTDIPDVMPRALLEAVAPPNGEAKPKQTAIERQEAKAAREAAKLAGLRIRSQARVDLELARKMLLAADYETALERAQCAVRELGKLVGPQPPESGVERE